MTLVIQYKCDICNTLFGQEGAKDGAIVGITFSNGRAVLGDIDRSLKHLCRSCAQISKSTSYSVGGKKEE